MNCNNTPKCSEPCGDCTQEWPRPDGAQSPAEGDGPGWLHVRGQFSWHGEAAVSGTRKGLESLRSQIDTTLAGGVAPDNYFASDGEGYELTVELLSDEAFSTSHPSYIQEACDKDSAYWRERAFGAEAKLHQLSKAQPRAHGWPDAADWLERESLAVYGACLREHAEAAQWLRDASTAAQPQPKAAKAHGLPSLPELVAEIKRLVRRVSDASYTQGIDEHLDSPARDQKNDDKVRGLLGEANAAIDRLAAIANTQPKAAEGDEARSRVAAYVQRRKQARTIDVEHIHGFDVGPDGGFELRLSDIEALIAQPDDNAGSAEEYHKALNTQPKGMPVGHKLAPLEPTPQMRKAAADAWLDCDSKLILNKAASALRAGIAAAPKEES